MLGPSDQSRRTPSGAMRPPVRVLWWPIADHSGTPTTGDQSPSGLNVLAQAAGISIAKTAVLTVLAGTPAWAAGGGLAHTGSAYFDVVPTGDELGLVQAMLDLSGFAPGETLMVGCEIVTPAGYAAAHNAQSCVACFGNLTSGSDAGGLEVGLSSVERPQIVVWPKGATAASVVTPTADFALDGMRNCIVWEITRGVAAGQFRCRTHVHNGALTSSAWTAETDWATPNSGTAAPGMGTHGLRIARRRGSTSVQSQNGEAIRNVWMARLPEEADGVAARACLEMVAAAMSLPRIIRGWTGGAASTYVGPDGNANQTFGAIVESDMFIAIDGATPFASTPELTMEVEQTGTPSVTKLSQIATHPQYVSDSSVEGLARIDTAIGGYKFVRHKTGPWANTILLSGHKSDVSNRGRAELTWQGPDVTLPLGVPMWSALRFWLDFPPPDVGLLVIQQLFPGYSGSGLYANLAIGVDTTAKTLRAGLHWSAVANTQPADMVPVPYVLENYTEDLFGRWVELVCQVKLHWDAAQGPLTRIWRDGLQLLDSTSPNVYRGPSGVTGKSTDPFARIGMYPPSPYLTPNTKRDFRFSRFFVCKAVSASYTEPQVRAALTAAGTTPPADPGNYLVDSAGDYLVDSAGDYLVVPA